MVDVHFTYTGVRATIDLRTLNRPPLLMNNFADSHGSDRAGFTWTGHDGNNEFVRTSNGAGPRGAQARRAAFFRVWRSVYGNGAFDAE